MRQGDDGRPLRNRRISLPGRHRQRIEAAHAPRGDELLETIGNGIFEVKFGIIVARDDETDAAFAVLGAHAMLWADGDTVADPHRMVWSEGRGDWRQHWRRHDPSLRVIIFAILFLEGAMFMVWTVNWKFCDQSHPVSKVPCILTRKGTENDN